MADDLSRILSADLEDDGDLVIEGTLRPRTLDEYIGQREVKANLSVLLTAARGGERRPTTSSCTARPASARRRSPRSSPASSGSTSSTPPGPAIERAGDLAAILTSLDERDVLFIDEIHRLNRAVEEILYPAMEDYALDVMIGKGPSARSLRLSLKPFTVVGATTRAGRISSPLRDRFGATYRLDFYTETELAAIVERSAVDPGGDHRRRRDPRHRPARPRDAAHRQPAAQARPRPRPGPRRRPRRRGDRDRGDARDGDRRRGPRLDRSQAAGRDRPEVRLGAGRGGGAGGRAVRGGRDDRGRLRAVPPAARVHRPDAAGPDRHRPRAGAPVRPRLRDPATAPDGAGHARAVGPAGGRRPGRDARR